MTFIWTLFNLIAGIFCLGFLFHSSSGEDLILNKYSSSYALFLLLLFTFWLFSAWFGLRRQEQFKGFLSSSLLIFLISSVLGLLLLPATYIYLHHRSLQKNVFSSIATNSHSFFQIEDAPNFPKDLSKDTFKILAIGGSTTFGAKLEREEAYPAVLEQLLRSRFPKKKIKVLNAGVPWHTSMHSLLRYVGKYSDWKPDVVIVLHAFNDIFQASEGQLTSGQFRSDYGHFFGALGKRINPKDKFSTLFIGFLNKNWFTQTWYSDFNKKNNPTIKKPVNLLLPLPTFKRNLSELIRRTTQDGATLIMATQPYLYKNKMPKDEKALLFYDFYYKDYALIPPVPQQKQAMDEFNDAVRKIASRTDNPIVDLEKSMPKTTVYMYDDVHYTKTGAKWVAEEINKHQAWDQFFNNN